jgi:GH25 family lysozyme M1 (1,4-beta-N-acetylmuramidase)
MPEYFADVSSWQGQIDWGAYRRGGYGKASMKATEGIGYTDPQYWNNEGGTRANGIDRIHYHFARPDLNPNSPEGEADWCWSVISGNFGPSDLAELDYEQDASGVNLEAWKNRWFARISSYTSRFGMYSGYWFTNSRGISWGPGFTHVALYGGSPPQADIWQYTDAASFPGIAGSVDGNQLLNPAIFPVVSPPPPPVVLRRTSVMTFVTQYGGNEHVFKVDGRGQLQHDWQAPGGPGWLNEAIPGATGLDPSKPINGDQFNGQVHVYAMTTAGGTLHAWQSLSGQPNWNWGTEPMP